MAKCDEDDEVDLEWDDRVNTPAQDMLKTLPNNPLNRMTIAEYFSQYQRTVTYGNVMAPRDITHLNAALRKKLDTQAKLACLLQSTLTTLFRTTDEKI